MDELDPLDAFMYNEVIPEVLMKEKEERDKYQSEKLEKIKKLSVKMKLINNMWVSNDKNRREGQIRFQRY